MDQSIHPRQPTQCDHEFISSGMRFAYYCKHCEVTREHRPATPQPTNDEVRRQLGPTGKEKTRHG